MNSVELIGHYGSDEIIACSAWTSTSRELNEDKRSRVGKLIKTLWENGHQTPFEKGVVHFLVDTDIASHIHLLKHRMSSLNAESARYKELKEDKYYVPRDWPDSEYEMPDLGNNGSFAWKSLIKKNWKAVLEDYTRLGNVLYHGCISDLEDQVGRKRIKESARFFKTYNSQIQADVMFNMRSFANFQNLRNSEHAQVEIREIARMMLESVRSIDGNPFRHTLEAFGL